MKEPYLSTGQTCCGCIDLGSSYFRLLVLKSLDAVDGESALNENSTDPVLEAHRGEATAADDELWIYEDRVWDRSFIVAEARKFVGWGSFLSRRKPVDDRAIESACMEIESLVEISRKLGCHSPILIGTNMFREAKNARLIKERLEKCTGLTLHVLSEEGEASLGFKGASTSVPRGRSVVVIDLGGTSTEISFGENQAMEGYSSIKLGTHRIAEWLRDPIVQKTKYRRGLIYYKEMLRRNLSESSILEKIGQFTLSRTELEIVATGGTAVSIAVISKVLFRKERSIVPKVSLEVDDLQVLRRRIQSLYSASKQFRLPLDSGRRLLLLPGLLLFEALLGSLKISRITITPRDLRWGAILSDGRFDDGELLY